MDYFHKCMPSFSFTRTFLVTEWQQVFVFFSITLALWLAGALIITTNTVLLSVLCDHYLRHFTAISNISLHCISLVFPFIRTLEFAQVRCTACITSRVANPIAEMRQEERGTNNRNRKPIRAKYPVLHRQENWQESNVFTGKERTTSKSLGDPDFQSPARSRNCWHNEYFNFKLSIWFERNRALN